MLIPLRLLPSAVLRRPRCSPTSKHHRAVLLCIQGSLPQPLKLRLTGPTKRPHSSRSSVDAMDDTATVLRKPKKLIICCDGTWMDSDSGYEKTGFFSKPSDQLQVPSNVTRIARSIHPEDENHHPQVVYYQAGVGTGLTFSDHLIGGGTGKGISEHIREAYSFLANNYTEGDSIFLIGFSRGAFTARSVAGLIGGMGLLEKDAMPFFYDVFKDWENAGVPKYKPKIVMRAGQPQSKGTSLEGLKVGAPTHEIKSYLKEYKDTLIERGLTRHVLIEAVGVWDTVGALGIPTLPLMQDLGFPDFFKEYKFFDTGIDDHIKNAFQALALDERRAAYAPTVWERGLGCKTNLKQVWFPGVHSNVGGSYADTGMADITLAWMMSQLSPWIDFKPHYLKEQHRLGQEYNKLLKPALTRGWAMGRLYNSALFPTSMGGVRHRTPHLYHGLNYITGKMNPHPLQNTHEFVHASVRLRVNLKGKGLEDIGTYNPAGLEDWTLREDQEYRDSADNLDGRMKGKVKWVYHGKEASGYNDPDTKKDPKVMYEDELGKYELDLLDLDLVTKKKILGHE